MAQDNSLPTAEQIEAAIVCLQPQERLVLDLAARDRMSNAAIAERLGIPVRAAEGLLARALCKLDRALERL